MRELKEMFAILLTPDNPMSIGVLLIVIIMMMVIVYSISIRKTLEPVVAFAPIGDKNEIKNSKGISEYIEDVNLYELISSALIGNYNGNDLKGRVTDRGVDAYQLYEWMYQLWRDSKTILGKEKTGVTIDKDTLKYVISYGEMQLKRDGSVVIKTSYGYGKVSMKALQRFCENPSYFDRIAVKMNLL